MIKKHFALIAVFGIGITLIAGIMLMFPRGFYTASAATTSTNVSVSATVNEWITLSISTSSVNLTPDLVDTAGNTAIGSSSNITMNVGTNAVSGWSVTIAGTQACPGALTSSSYSINQPTATSSLAAGTDGYGANATTSLAGVTIGAYYNYWGTNTVGEICSSAQTLSSKSTANTSQTVTTIKIEAACDSLQEAGTYTDTITLTATGSA